MRNQLVVPGLWIVGGLVVGDVHGKGTESNEETWNPVPPLELQQRVSTPGLVLLPLEAYALGRRHLVVIQAL